MIKIFFALIILASLASSYDNDEDYWKPTGEKESKKTLNEVISLTRDHMGRENPDSTPMYGFFPVWPAMLLCLSGKFFNIELGAHVYLLFY